MMDGESSPSFCDPATYCAQNTIHLPQPHVSKSVISSFSTRSLVSVSDMECVRLNGNPFKSPVYTFIDFFLIFGYWPEFCSACVIYRQVRALSSFIFQHGADSITGCYCLPMFFSELKLKLKLKLKIHIS